MVFRSHIDALVKEVGAVAAASVRDESRVMQLLNGAIQFLQAACELRERHEAFVSRTMLRAGPECSAVIDLVEFLSKAGADKPLERGSEQDVLKIISSIRLRRKLGEAAADAQSFVRLVAIPARRESVVRGALDGATRALDIAISAAQRVAFQLMMAPITAALAQVPQLTHGTWSAADSVGGAPAGFGGPSEYMLRVVDHLMTLVPELEPFAARTTHARMHADKAALLAPELRKIETVLQLADGSLKLASSSDGGGRGGEQAAEPVDDSIDLFSGSWLEAVAASAENGLMLQIAKVPHFSASGAEQMAVDIDYLERHVQTVGGESQGFMTACLAAFRMDKADLESAGHASGETVERAAGAIDQAVAQLVARLRQRV